MLQKIINFIEEKNMKWQHCMHELEKCVQADREENYRTKEAQNKQPRVRRLHFIQTGNR